MLWAKPAVVRTSLANLGAEFERKRPGLVEAGDLGVELSVAENQGFEPPVVGAALAHDDPVVAKKNLGIDDAFAFGTDAASELPEDLRSVLLHLITR